ncbi:Transposon Ty3-I Gag-Pol polyprotein [Stylophora pistillata]|uniref:Transposon Ty3-I Gag-Pol polyprotein n=1 Tax=Stylophora pistillata TaxID=50429 RepID=A0A2B4S744_STYPI|nr:Transposon Ty3-I Gag-Pol polyprotein [Stylophora pistillata]
MERRERREEMERRERLEREEGQERLEKEKLAFQHEMEMKKLEVQMQLGLVSGSEKHGENFDVTKHIRLVPPFQETNLEKYFLHFEKVEESLKWPKEYWAMLLQSVLLGKAREIYTQLTVEQASNYDTVKELIRKGYELVLEAYRKKFRKCLRMSNQTYIEFARTKEQLFDRWCSLQKVDKDHDRLRQVVLIEEFKRCIHSDVRTFINEQKAETLEEAARLADDYSLTHKFVFEEKPSGFTSSQGQNLPTALRNPQKENPNQRQTYRSSSRPSSTSFIQNKPEVARKPFKSITCYYCRREGHLMSECPEKLKTRRQQGHPDSKPTGFIAASRLTPVTREDFKMGIPEEEPFCQEVSSTRRHVMEMFEPFIHEGSVALSSDLSDAVSVKILRDTGASQSLLLAETLPFSEKSSTGASVLFKGVNSFEYSPVPPHTVYLSSNLVSGPVNVGLGSSLPFEGIQLLLGSDLAGDKVVMNPIVTDVPCVEQLPDPVEKEIPDLYPACAVTRAMNKKKLSDEDKVVDIASSAKFSKELSQRMCREQKSQGALERWHQTLKNTMKIYSFETERDWDEGIHLLSFAARESVQESLGFSPFELVFGHTVRGPLKLLKEKFLSSESHTINLLQYVSDFRTKLNKACELARANPKLSEKSMKERYDINTSERCFDPCQKVLALLPVPANPLHARYFGPYVIKEKLSSLNYVLETPDRRKQTPLCHVNTIKPYIERDSGLKIHPVSLNVVSFEPEETLSRDLNSKLSPLAKAKLSNYDVLRDLDSKLSHLSSIQSQDLTDLLQEFKHLFPDVATSTEQIYHDVDVGDASPVKQHPYRLNPMKQKYLKEKIQFSLENDLIEPSHSSWSSPCILVPKPDGSYRMCTDYQKVNRVSNSDTFPIPRMDDYIDKVGNARYVTKFDLLKGFWQVPLTERAKEISAFVTPDGLYQYKVMPFGMKNSPATFQHLINKVIAGLHGCEAYIDDVIIYSNTWEEHLKIIRKFFERLTEAKLTINSAKSEFAQAQVTYLGHVVGQGKVKPVDAKISVISKFRDQKTRNNLCVFSEWQDIIESSAQTSLQSLNL